MYRSQAVTVATLTFACLVSAAPLHTFSGAKALAYTREAVADGPRPSGSPAIHRLQGQIVAALKSANCVLSFDDFVAATPDGPVKMRNILCKFAGKSGKAIVITGHYDTKRLPRFVGADDGGSSTGFLMELAQALNSAPRVDDIILVFFDGEEAVHEWTATDSVYGSRHLADAWQKNGTLAHIKALINVDMIGDKDLGLLFDTNSDESLAKMVWDLGDRLGYSAHFPRTPSAIEDDHIPFAQRGVRVLDLIDFSFGPQNSYWHTPQDTMDKLGANSFDVVGTVLMDAIRQLEASS